MTICQEWMNSTTVNSKIKLECIYHGGLIDVVLNRFLSVRLKYTDIAMESWLIYPSIVTLAL